MEKQYLLHMITPDKNLSAFDVNMAFDAGWTAMPYLGVELDEVTNIVQDAIFSRGPKGLKRTGIFIGGKDMHLAMDMFNAAKEAMVPPFAISVFTDPGGAFTTAAAMVAIVTNQLKIKNNEELKGQRILVLGGTGPVGASSAVLAAKLGAKVTILGRAIDKANKVADLCNTRYGTMVAGIEGDANDHIDELLQYADVIFATAKAGVQVLNEKQVTSAVKLKVAADLNAVPPAGIAGIKPHDNGIPINGSKIGAVGIGPLTIGDIKYHTQRELLIQMHNAERPLYLHFEDAFKVAMDQVH
ncbi:MAG: methylenetetrahydromethanopterin dehydrogenase [Gammaproteobacteria bacterium]|nr:methylenetetrahydromethanopterin dehydrogenase [Gammaproteobacteria bacterium]